MHDQQKAVPFVRHCLQQVFQLPRHKPVPFYHKHLTALSTYPWLGIVYNLAALNLYYMGLALYSPLTHRTYLLHNTNPVCKKKTLRNTVAPLYTYFHVACLMMLF